MKFFLIGLGSIGTRHAKNLITLGHTVWGYDKSVQTALNVKEQLPGLEIAADMWDCDAYVICTPPDQHIPEMMNAIEYGKHVFVEKPIGVPQDIEPLSKLLEEAKRKNLVVMVGNMLRFHPKVREAKQRIKRDDIVFKVLQKNERYTEHVILNWGAHEIDLALYLLGPGECCVAKGSREKAVVTVDHGDFVMSEIHMDYLMEPEVRSFTMNGEEFDLRLPDWNDVYMDEMKEFIARISYETPDPDTGICIHFGAFSGEGALGEDGLATLKIIADAMRMTDAS